ncbi:hypothetical protein AWB99_21800 [Mycolicibacterium confluentis]|nr:hypothetical protein AWB99_21800 [Mycolicibacterium confluentis]
MRMPSRPADSAMWKQRHLDALADEEGLDFPFFDHARAWKLGSAMVSTAVDAALPVTIAIAFGEQRVFHAALAGSAATNDDWMARKFRAVAKHNCSSWAVACEARTEPEDYYIYGGYRTEDIALAGGAVPLRVCGSLIGAVGVSGLSEYDDHRFAVDAIRAFRASVTP